MVLKASLTADEHGALPDTEKTNYKLVGSAYVPDIEGIENLAGLTSALASERTARETAEKSLKPYQGVDVAKYQQLIQAEKDQHLGSLTSKGDYDTALATVKSDYDTQITALKKQMDEKDIDYGLKSALVDAGVIKERLDDAMMVTRPRVTLLEDRSLGLLKDGKPDLTVDFKKFASEVLKAEKPWYYAPGNGKGTGAENGTRGTGATPVKTRKEFDGMTPQEKIDFSILQGQGKAQLVDD